jgi:osmotically-inducible protein OsmY
MICKNCNNNFADAAKFCPKCGTKAENQVAVQDTQMRKCPKCGTENLQSAKFCKVDGYNFQQVEDKTIAPIVEADKPSDKVICPKCGEAYDCGIKFCKKDGTSLQKDAPKSEPAAPPETSSGTKQAPPTPQRSQTDIAAPKAVIVEPAVPSKNDKKTVQPRAEKAGGRKAKKIVVAVATLVLLIISGAVGYLYFTGYIWSSPDKIATKINDELRGKGLGIYCEIDKDWTATLRGTARNAADKDLATNIASSHKELKNLKYDVQMPLSPSDVRMAIDTALRDGGLGNIHAEVDDNLTATLQGVANNNSEKENAMKLAVGLGKAKDVKDNIQIQAAMPQPVAPEMPAIVQQTPRQATRPRADVTRKEVTRQAEPTPRAAAADPVKMEGELNRALRNAGLSGITAEVRDDLSVTLKGSTGNAEDKSRAFEVAKSFNGIKKVRDRIFVVR